MDHHDHDHDHSHNHSHSHNPSQNSIKDATDATHHLKGPKIQRRRPIRDNYRIFLSLFILAGITLFNYSRSAKYISAVQMIASNVIAKELAMSRQNVRSHADASIASDQSCPVAQFSAPSQLPAPQALGVGVPLMVDLEEGPTDEPAIIELEPAYRNNTSLSRESIEQMSIEAQLVERIMQQVNRGELVDWSPKEQGLIFVMNSVGNLASSIPMTRLAEVHGPNKVIIVSGLAASLHTVMFPTVAKMPVIVIIFYELMFGSLIHGTENVVYTFLANWLPPIELAFFVSATVAAYQIGATLSNFISAQLLSIGYHWSTAFYVPGCGCAIWTLIWIIAGANEPAQCRFVTQDELAYIRWNKGIQEGHGEEGDKKGAHKEAPWRQIFTDSTVWSLVVSKFCTRWHFAVTSTLMPTYLNNVVHADLNIIGRISAANNIIGLVSGLTIGYLSKSVVVSRPFGWSLTCWRKIFQSIAIYGMAISVFTMTLFDCELFVVMASLVANCILINFAVAGVLQVPMDMSIGHCSLIASITNSIAVGQIVGNPVSGVIIAMGPQDRFIWRIVWWIVCVFHVIGATTFCIFADCSPRTYNTKKQQAEMGNKHATNTTDDNHNAGSKAIGVRKINEHNNVGYVKKQSFVIDER